MPQPTPDYRVDYIEFGANDISVTRKFYETAFGWEFTDYGPGYTSFQDGRLAGGFTTDVKPGGGPLVVLYANNLEAALERVRSAGAKIVKDTFEFPGGRRFHFADPSGNELAVWSDKQPT
jgi:predicted enzyme related to lactoylglutathione lyase